MPQHAVLVARQRKSISNDMLRTELITKLKMNQSKVSLAWSGERQRIPSQLKAFRTPFVLFFKRNKLCSAEVLEGIFECDSE